jgi:histidinol dehydrogenase
MKTYINPGCNEWPAICKRPSSRAAQVRATVSEILEGVRERGDEAVAEFSLRFDGAIPASVRVTPERRDLVAQQVDANLVAALQQAISNISSFHTSQRTEEHAVDTCRGVTCFRRSVPIERVGIYIPGGTAPLFSTLMMLAVPAQVAGVREIVLCTPGGRDGALHPVIACVASLLCIDEIYLIGGAQAIGALAYGTASIPPVQKVCGPGNAYVTEAKMQVAAQGVAIEMPAGPSEVLVIADSGADPRFVAADLLAQAEHGPDSQVVVVTTDAAMLAKIESELARQVAILPRREFAIKALEGSVGVVVSSPKEAMAFSNTYAPEHLIISVADADRYVSQVVNAGSVFLGYMAAEALGDYASGTNHVLPTNGAACAFSGVSVDTFMKKITFQRVSEEGLRALAPTVACMARAEGLEAHARAVLIREEALRG